MIPSCRICANPLGCTSTNNKPRLSRGGRRIGYRLPESAGMRRTYAAFVIVATAASAAVAQSNVFPVDVLDAARPKLPLPNNRAVGHPVGTSMDSADRWWVVHCQRTFMPPQCQCCAPVLAFDGSGSIIQAWGGPPHQDLPKAWHGGPRASWVETGPIPPRRFRALRKAAGSQ